MCQKMHKRSSWIKLLRKVSPWSRKHQKGIELFIAPTYFIHLHSPRPKFGVISICNFLNMSLRMIHESINF
jgi:hypothetical protein